MTSNDEQALTQVPTAPRRRLLAALAALLGGGVAVALTGHLKPSGEPPNERPLREADFYRPHDLAG